MFGLTLACLATLSPGHQASGAAHADVGPSRCGDHLAPGVARLLDSIKGEPQLSSGKIKAAIEAAGITEQDLLPWADLQHSPQDSYGRKVICTDGAFEVLVMTWLPGDVSAIHDHGTDMRHGCVQVFGNDFEHATYASDGEALRMCACVPLRDGQTVAVGSELIHQLGNVGTAARLSLHVYSRPKPDPTRGVTDDTRIFEARNSRVPLVNGGAFLALPPDAKHGEALAVEPDFTTWLRDMLLTTRRARTAAAAGEPIAGIEQAELLDALFAQPAALHARLLKELDSGELVSASGHHTDSRWWAQLHRHVREWAALEAELRAEGAHLEADRDPSGADSFAEYAEMYDALIGKPCLDGFMAHFIDHFFATCVPRPEECRLLSVGCGTGLVEEHIVRTHGVRHDRLLGFDLSDAQVAVASGRIRARVGDVLRMAPAEYGHFDVAFAGLNVLHYLPATRMHDAVRNIAASLVDGGYFFGDFITPDHIRWYPNLMLGGEGRRVISLRTPRLVAEGGRTYQESSIVNIDLRGSRVRLNDAGTHRRHLPSMLRVRELFEEAFGGPVTLCDAVSLEPLPREADTCPSTRYVVIAQKRSAPSTGEVQA